MYRIKIKVNLIYVCRYILEPFNSDQSWWSLVPSFFNPLLCLLEGNWAWMLVLPDTQFNKSMYSYDGGMLLIFDLPCDMISLDTLFTYPNEAA